MSSTTTPAAAIRFFLNVVGPKVASGRFVTPDEDVTLLLHCHVAAHDKVGMIGMLIVGRGGAPKALSPAATRSNEPRSLQGTGVVMATVPRAGRLIVKHEEIRGFMGAREMSFPVTPPSLLNGLNAGDRIQFTIDAARSVITSIEVVESAR